MKKIVGEIETPEFQGTHLWERLCWAKENLERFETDYRVVYEDPNNQMHQQKYYTQHQNGWRVHYRVEYYHLYLLIGNSKR